ncbi:unnamed protein product (macronuclear) [Paramecium tetraurelia]|uniref:Transmembrane protein n=1 Tax=Paramecium tetraurelia TaxID=5888 RepID=A0DTE5_PARTE|nr:uncharacterized protein GSPATT00019993001 [Paramecium tetraurelia]CAK86312.1 unnamed protein product [Paramecium tetraurelia]|eukprot:XP_001453709.1 hypothetical protein (macronuclear) [Paramecium tetraurelia strain d4-2]
MSQRKLFRYYIDQSIQQQNEQKLFLTRVNRWRFNTLDKSNFLKSTRPIKPILFGLACLAVYGTLHLYKQIGHTAFIVLMNIIDLLLTINIQLQQHVQSCQSNITEFNQSKLRSQSRKSHQIEKIVHINNYQILLCRFAIFTAQSPDLISPGCYFHFRAFSNVPSD